MLIMEQKPVGEERSVKMISMFQGLNKIRDDEHPSVKLFLSEEKQMDFDEQRAKLARGSTVRMVFPPKYSFRPTLAAIEKKLEEWAVLGGIMDKTATEADQAPTNVRSTRMNEACVAYATFLKSNQDLTKI
ncbi:unnamed protein product [Caenorhabditis nigoni]